MTPFNEDWRIFNIEKNKPTVAEARKLLLDEISRAKRDFVTALILIHGYGSHGVGGRLKIELTKQLYAWKSQKFITDFVPGERWSETDRTSLRILSECPGLELDPDLNRRNLGITIVLL